MYTPVDSRLWHDEWVRTLTSDEKLLFFYLLTNLNRNMLGLYILPPAYAQDGTQLTDEQFLTAWDALMVSGKVAYDATARVVFIKNFLRYNPISGTKQLKGALKRLHEIPKTRLFGELLKVCHEVLNCDSEDAHALLSAIEVRAEAWEE